jgi:hypothetical protein
MKAKLTRFYLDHVEPKIATLKTKISQVKQWLAGRWAATKAKATEIKTQIDRWLTRHRRSLWLAAVAIVFLMIGAGLAIMWQRSPLFRAMAKTLGVAILSVLVTLWALLKGLGLTMAEGLTGLARGLAGLSRGVLSFLRLLGSRLTRPVIKVVIVPRPTGESVPVPPVDGRL